MDAEALPFFELLSPLMVVIGTIYLLSPTPPTVPSLGTRAGLCGGVAQVIARYLDWRLFTTVMPVKGEWYQVSWVWFCFVVEILALFDALILYLAFFANQRPSHRSRPS